LQVEAGRPRSLRVACIDRVHGCGPHDSAGAPASLGAD
jgi:hypothetical protein